MSTTTGQSLSWSDIQTIYNNINTARTKFSMSQITVPSNPGLAKPAAVSDLKTQIEAMDANSYVHASGYAINHGVVVPSSGASIVPEPFNKATTAVSNIQGVCVHNASWDSGFGWDSGFDWDSGFGFNSGFNSSHDGFNSGYESGFDWFSGDFGADDGSYCSSFDWFSGDFGIDDTSYCSSFGWK